MTKQSIWASLIFGITFTLVTAYLLVNIFISIVEEAYFIARKQGRYLELLMWRNLKTIAKSKHPDPGDMKDFDADVTTLVIAPNPTSKHSASLLGQLQELDKLTAAHDVSSQSVGDVPNMSRGEDKLRDTLTEQHQSRSYRALVRELLDATVPDSHLAERQGLQSDSLTITLAEETAEIRYVRIIGKRTDTNLARETWEEVVSLVWWLLPPSSAPLSKLRRDFSWSILDLDDEKDQQGSIPRVISNMPEIKIALKWAEFGLVQFPKVLTWAAPGAVFAGWMVYPALTPGFKSQLGLEDNIKPANI
eukprot:gene9197-11811_t